MITDGEKWHHLTVKSLPVLLRGITSTHKEDFYCLYHNEQEICYICKKEFDKGDKKTS